jgi:hypothetical protein
MLFYNREGMLVNPLSGEVKDEEGIKIKDKL